MSVLVVTIHGDCPGSRGEVCENRTVRLGRQGDSRICRPEPARTMRPSTACERLRNMRLCYSSVIKTLGAVLVLGGTLTPGAEKGAPEPVAIFSQTSDTLYRIPSLVVANDGSVLAFCSCRKGGVKDFGHDSDVVLRRSSDGGSTFGPISTLMTKPGADIHHGPAVVERNSGRLFKFGKFWPGGADHKAAMHTIDESPYAKMVEAGWIDHVVISDDHGRTWSPPSPVPLDFPSTAFRCGTGNGNHGIQLRDGRLILQAGHMMTWEGFPDALRMHLGTFFSDDGGTTWKRGINIPHQQVREFAIVERLDGRLLLSIRATPRPANDRFNPTARKISGGQMLALSEDRGESIASSWLNSGLPYGDSNTGMVILHDGSAHGLIIHSTPMQKRTKLALHTSPDGGATWRLAHTLDWNGVGYSDLALSPDRQVLHCLFEAKVPGKKSVAGVFHLRLPVQLLRQ